MEIAIPLYDQMTALDAIGPYEALNRIPGSRVRFVGAAIGEVRTDTGMLGLTVDAALEDVTRPDVVVVPGGIGSRAVAEDERWIAWAREAHAHTTWTTSVCTGALLLGAAGILDGLRATTHWSSVALLGEYGAEPVSDERVVEDGKVITAAGVSAGIDMGLTLAARLAGEDVARAAQLMLEYAPEPPFDGGTLATTPPAALERLPEMLVPAEIAFAAQQDLGV